MPHTSSATYAALKSWMMLPVGNTQLTSDLKSLKADRQAPNDDDCLSIKSGGGSDGSGMFHWSGCSSSKPCHYSVAVSE